MTRKNDILEIYSREVEDIREAGLFQLREAPFCFCLRARVKWKTAENFACVQITILGWGTVRTLIDAAKRTYDEKGYGVASVRFIWWTQDIHKKAGKEDI